MPDPDKASRALVVPLCARELPALARNLFLWGTSGLRPILDSGHGVGKPALRLLWNDDLDAGREDFVDRVFHRSGCASCFLDLAHEYCRLDPSEDHYERQPASGPVSALGFYAGPNRMFFEMMERFGDRHPAIFLMETDCFPLGPGWLQRLLDGFAANPSAWVFGSRYAGIGRLPARKRRHINGNALYRTGDPLFLGFVEKVWKTGLERYVRDRDPKVAYDSFLEELASEWAPTPGRDSLGELKQILCERFLATPLMRNYGGSEDTRRLGWTFDQLRRGNPEALVVHGQWFAREAEVIVGSIPNAEWSKTSAEASAFAFSRAGSPRPVGAPVWRNRVELKGSAWLCGDGFELPAKGDRVVFRHRIAPGMGRRFIVARVRASNPAVRVEALLMSINERPAASGLALLGYYARKSLEKLAVLLGVPLSLRAALAGHRRWRIDASTATGACDVEFGAACPKEAGTLELWIAISAGASPASGMLLVEAGLRDRGGSPSPF